MALREPPRPTVEELEAEVFRLRQERVLRLADAERLIAWMDDPHRVSANLAFTEGNERQIAYRFEILLKRGRRE